MGAVEHQPLGYAGPPDGDPEVSRHASLAAELRGLRQEVAESAAAQQAMWQQVAAGFETADANLLGLRVDLADALEAVRDRIVATVSNTGDTTRTALTETTTGVAKVTERLQESLLDRLEEQHSAVRARLAEVAAQSLASAAATRNTQERLASLTTATEQVGHSVQALQGDWNVRVDEASARASAAAEQSVTELRERVDAAVEGLAAAAAGLVDTHRRLDEATALLQLQVAGMAGPQVHPGVDAQTEFRPSASVEPEDAYWDEPEPESEDEPEDEPESEYEDESESESEPEREDLDPAEQEPGPAAWYADPEPATEQAPEPAPTDAPRPPRRPVPRWRRY